MKYLGLISCDNKETAFSSRSNIPSFQICFPTTYGRTRFESLEQVKAELDSNSDAKGLYAQCAIYGAGIPKEGDKAVDMLFASANAGCSDAILYLGRLYEHGMSFIRKNKQSAVELYRYAYSLQNIDALHSLGFILYSCFDKKDIGISMMRKSAELGSRGARFHLQLIEEDIRSIIPCAFSAIPKEEFQYNNEIVQKSISLYDVDLKDPQSLRNALLETMKNMTPQTYSVIMNEFRILHLRGRELQQFSDVNFKVVFDMLVQEGEIETVSVNNYGVTENTLYIVHGSSKKMKTIIIDDDWDL